MKKPIVKICLIIFVFLSGLILYDRHLHIGYNGEYDDQIMVSIRDSWFVKFPYEAGFDFREEGLKPDVAFAYAESLTPILKIIIEPKIIQSWWIVNHKESGEPLLVYIADGDISDDYLFHTFDVNLQVSKVVDGVEVSYGPSSPSPVDHFSLSLIKGERRIVMQFAYSILDELTPVLNKVWNEIK